MKLYRVRGGTEEDLTKRHYNLGVGISLGNKWFSAENIISLVEWSLEHTKEYVIVYVADSIHAINIEVRNSKTPEKAKEIAEKLSSSLLEQVKTIAEEKFTDEQRSKIFYSKWEGLFTPSFREKVDFLYQKYATDEMFKNTIIQLVEGFTNNENRTFSYQDKEKLGTYLIEEFPELLARTPIDGRTFDAYAYPFDGSVTELVDNIQKGYIFPYIKSEIIDTEPKVFLEVRE